MDNPNEPVNTNERPNGTPTYTVQHTNSNNPILIALLIVAVFVAGFFIARSMNGTAMPFNTSSDTTHMSPGSNTATQGTATHTVPAANLTDGQRKMLSALGIDPNKVTITPSMVACSEAKLGAARIEQIKNGATPSMSEGLTLMACYK